MFALASTHFQTQENFIQFLSIEHATFDGKAKKGYPLANKIFKPNIAPGHGQIEGSIRRTFAHLQAHCPPVAPLNRFAKIVRGLWQTYPFAITNEE